MSDLSVNIVDLAILAIMLISGLLALFRGFVREVLAIAGWIGAAIVTLKLFPYAQPFAHRYIAQPLLADLAAAAVIFVAVLVMLWVVAAAISRRVQESDIGPLDRSLGFLFGLARGFVLISLAYLILIQFAPPREHPQEVREARALPVIRYGAAVLLQLAPNQMREELGRHLRNDRADGQNPTAGDSHVQKTDTDDKSGYTSQQRQELDRFIRSTTDN